MNQNRKLNDQFVDFQPQLFIAALRFTKDEDAAGDLVQDTLLKACRFSGSFEPGSNLKAWLFTILRNTYINNYRKHQKYDECDVEAISHWYPAKEESQKSLCCLIEYMVRNTLCVLRDSSEIRFRNIEPILRLMFSDTMLSALEAIPEINAIPIILCDLLDIQYNEAADIIGCPVGTVMSRIFRGREKLQIVLASVVGYTIKGEVFLKETMKDVPRPAA
ncbi:MAG: sigma-70 family RNA polymerase sigma factor [Candidatus Sungbacteria bacterium]|nr:sigma-70 family RNA polymerase sigma factor [Candidatus Sungbacteria bacterium]